ncbi:MAG TPA: long-chain fatty acid--CoA ligase [Thermoleophilaceae bacterium]|nr:long-chain fatty acid--CoA ligase [Thermoleophilaceae bacterium]
MEAAVSAREFGTGTSTMAAQLPADVAKHSGKPALRYKAGDEWRDISYDEVGEAVREIALGLVDIGIQPRERVAILSHTRPEWTLVNFGILTAGATSVSIYQTNSPEECHYVLDHSESRAVFVEDGEQLAKIRQVEGELPNLEHVIVMAPEEGLDLGDALSLDELRERGRGRDASEWEQRIEGVTPEDPCVFIYTSGTTGPPKGCVLTHGNYASIREMIFREGTLQADEVIYLFLPLAHSFALLIQFLSLDLGSVLAYWEKDPQKVIPNLMEVKPTYFPSVPRIFEKLYTLAMSNAEDPELLRKAVDVGMRVRQMRERGEEVPAELQTHFDQADEKLFKNVRALFGGRMRYCASGAAPIAKEILEFFYACGVPVLEGWGMTETSTAATVNRPEEYRLGSVGKPLPGVEIRIADDGEILLRGANIFREYYRNEDATREALEGGWLHTGDVGRIDDDGFLYITGRKKDIIITAGGKNITPANLENDVKQCRWVSQCVVIGDRRPYLVALVTLDPEEVPAFAEQHGLKPEDVAGSDEMRAEVQRAIDETNAKVGRVEQIKKFEILPHDLSQPTGELTPTLKVKRNVVAEKYGDRIEALYAA